MSSSLKFNVRLFILLFCSILYLKILGQSILPGDVLNPRNTSNGYVSDVEGVLKPEYTDSISSILATLERNTTVQSAVVVLNTIGDQNVFTFSQELFDHWGIGQARNNNGLLILLIMDQKTVRIHTGYGLEGVLPDAITKRIQLNEMLPFFKTGQYGRGLLKGIKKIDTIIEAPESIEEVRATREDFFEFELLRWILLAVGLPIVVIWFFVKRKKNHFNLQLKGNNDFPGERIGQGLWILFYGVVPLILFLLCFWMLKDLLSFFLIAYGYAALMFIWRRIRMASELAKMESKKMFRRAYQYMDFRQPSQIVLSVLFPVPFLIWLPVYFRKKNYYRVCARPCGKCDKIIVARLDEKSDDEHLSLSQKFEESIESLDYDVWFCRSCGAKEVLRYPGKKSGYEECPKCTVQAYYLESTITLVSATATEEGLREETKACKYCGLVAKRKFSIPKVETSASGGSGHSGSGSFGGGRSGGGGSSSSW